MRILTIDSMSIEVYIINLVIGIGTFFILRWAFSKIAKTNKVLRNALAGVGTIILTPLIYVTLVVIFFSVLFYQPTRDFDREKWFADKEGRYEMRDDLMKSEILKNKNKKEVVDILGLPDFG